MNSLLLVSDYINKNQDIKTMRNELYQNGIKSKYFKDDELMLIYTNYQEDNEKNFTLKNECRSLILDTKNKKIVSYTCNTPITNFEAMDCLIENTNFPIELYRCYEGTMLSLFYHNSKWYLSTRRCLNAYESKWKDKTHGDMFDEVLGDKKNELLNRLDKDKSYYFILVHHENSNIVDYSYEFGKKYKKLVLAFTRDNETQEETIFEGNLEDIDNVVYPNKVESLSDFKERNNNDTNFGYCYDEGIIIKLKLNNGINKILKLQTYNYQFNKAIGSERNIYKGFLILYQNGNLKRLLENNNYLSKFRKIVNPINISESYDTIGIVDSLFKVITSEIYELFKMLWNIKTGKRQDENLYLVLPKEYKMVLYGIRGIYFKNKAENINSSIFKSSLQIKDVYQFIKKLNADTLEELIRIRKLMLNWVKSKDTNESHKFSKVSAKCDKVHLKLTAILTNKLFPNIMPEDMP